MTESFEIVDEGMGDVINAYTSVVMAALDPDATSQDYSDAFVTFDLTEGAADPAMPDSLELAGEGMGDVFNAYTSVVMAALDLDATSQDYSDAFVTFDLTEGATAPAMPDSLELAGEGMGDVFNAYTSVVMAALDPDATSQDYSDTFVTFDLTEGATAPAMPDSLELAGEGMGDVFIAYTSVVMAALDPDATIQDYSDAFVTFDLTEGAADPAMPDSLELAGEGMGSVFYPISMWYLHRFSSVTNRKKGRHGTCRPHRLI